MEVALPSDDATLLTWSVFLFLWNLATTVTESLGSDDQLERAFSWVALLIALTYLGLVSNINRSPIQTILLSFLPLLLLIQHLPALKRRLTEKYRAEYAVALTVVAILASGNLIAYGHLRIGDLGVKVPSLSITKQACLFFTGSIVVYMSSISNTIIRGVIEKGGVQPRLKGRRSTYNAGRYIGTVERILVLSAIAIPKYEAIAFLFAAKGLLRSKDLEQRDFAEYFILGTLLSLLISSAAGTILRMFVIPLWH
jgi:hypothetical protein